MSRQREISIRRSDLTISEAFEMALAQLGVHFSDRHMPYFHIYGNKDEGMVHVDTFGNSARVYLHGKGEVFFYVDHITFERINDQDLPESKVVWVHDMDHNGNHLQAILDFYTTHRETMIYQVVGMAMGFDVASSVLHFLWKYPKVTVEDEDFVLSYDLDCCGVESIKIRYNRTYGYTTALVNSRKFVCSPITYVWHEE